jgi:hypothetical protein
MKNLATLMQSITRKASFLSEAHKIKREKNASFKKALKESQGIIKTGRT